MSNYRADPAAIAALGPYYEKIAAYLRTLSDYGDERLALIIDACGDDDMGKQIQANLVSVAKRVEEAILSIVFLVENQTNVSTALANKLNVTEVQNANYVQTHANRVS